MKYQEEKTRAADPPEQTAVFLAQRTRKSRYQVVIDSVGDIVYSHAADGILTAVNPAFEQILGWKPDAWIGQQFTALLHPDEVAIAVELMEACLRGDTVPAVEFHLRTSGGEYRLLELRYALDGREGEPPCVIGIARDVTERRQVESQQRALEAWRADVQRLDSLSALATGVAHGFNNVLTAILGRAELALALLPPESPAREDIRHIQVAAHRAEALARQLHVYSGEGEPVFEPISLSDLVREMAPFLSADLPRRVKLDLQLGDDLPLVDADPLLLPQVVTNLVVNASEAIGDASGTVTIRTSMRPIDPDGHPADDLGRTLRCGSYVGLDVSDTGVGMDADTMTRLFDPFFTTKGTGRGLGLAAVRGIVLEHGAPIHISSVRGAGSTVAISLRLSAAAVVAVAVPVVDASVDGHGTGTILVVDDEEPVRKLARMTLERAGFSVVTATDGIDALNVYKQHAGEIRAVVLDLMMPRMDGAATLRELHRLRSDLPIILSSGFIAQKAAEQFTAGSLAGMIQKPYVSSQLVAAVCQAIAGA